MIKISPVSDHKCHLGEGPLWDSRAEALWWVDSLAPSLYRYDFHTRKTQIWNLSGKTIGSLAVCENGNLILAMDKGFYHFYPDSGTTKLINQPLLGKSAIRFNDGKVDPFGNFIAGAMNIDHCGAENCSMFKLSPELKVTTLLDGFTCFNGPCFSLKGNQIYLTGRKKGEIEIFDYDTQRGVSNGASLITGNNPDGATVDQEGYIWSAQWTNECIIRISPEGKIDFRIFIPRQIVSSVMFGGPDLDLIYVTTVGEMVGNDKPSAHLAGATLAIKGAGFKGRPEPRFRNQLDS